MVIFLVVTIGHNARVLVSEMPVREKLTQPESLRRAWA